MKTLSHKFCSLILSFALVLDLHAQIDSLKKVLGIEKEDTNKVNTFIAVGNEYKYHEIYDEAIANLFNALSLSEKIKFSILPRNGSQLCVTLSKDSAWRTLHDQVSVVQNAEPVRQ